MRQTLRLFRPAPNQNIESPRLWQDPVLGYFETHGKMEFLPGEQYNLTDEQKKAVLWRYRVKEILKKEYLRREFDPHTLKYKQGIVVDPAMFRWYAADMTQSEFFRQTPRAWFLYAGSTVLFVWLYTKICIISQEKSKLECSKGNLLWWDRFNGRRLWVAGSAHPTPYYGYDY
uniref:NADH dehydrogenase [ubiquinone] 1 beta subcomplex subunit 4 n=1 Tax=Globodera rostochiensis TaxID=31243 RepID=A0A914HTB3_GLORO